MLTYTPTRRGSAHIVVPSILIAAALILFLAASLGITPKLPLQLLAAALLTAAIQLIGRYALTNFTYTLSDTEGNPPDCIIITRQRGGAITREYIPTARITAILPTNSPIPAEIKARHNLCVSMVGASPYAILFDDPVSGNAQAALLECSPDFAARIEERIRPITPSL